MRSGQIVEQPLDILFAQQLMGMILQQFGQMRRNDRRTSTPGISGYLRPLQITILDPYRIKPECGVLGANAFDIFRFGARRDCEMTVQDNSPEATSTPLTSTE